MSLFNTGIRPAIDDYLQKKSEEVRDYGEYFSASSAGHCMRMQMFARLGVPVSPEMAEHEANKTRIFESGHIFHEWLQRITKNAGLSVAQELEVQDEELMIRGHIDDLVMVPPAVTEVEEAVIDTTAKLKLKPGHLILYDYKTAHSASFSFKKGRPIGYYHSMQLATYIYLLRKLTDHQPDEGRILSISKDDLRLHEDQLIWSDEWVGKVEDYWQTLNKFWAERKLPPCTCLDHDGGFFGRRSKKGKIYNNYFYNETPCSLEWFKLSKAKEKAA